MAWGGNLGVFPNNVISKVETHSTRGWTSPPRERDWPKRRKGSTSEPISSTRRPQVGTKRSLWLHYQMMILGETFQPSYESKVGRIPELPALSAPSGLRCPDAPAAASGLGRGAERSTSEAGARSAASLCSSEKIGLFARPRRTNVDPLRGQRNELCAVFVYTCSRTSSGTWLGCPRGPSPGRGRYRVSGQCPPEPRNSGGKWHVQRFSKWTMAGSTPSRKKAGIRLNEVQIHASGKTGTKKHAKPWQPRLHRCQNNKPRYQTSFAWATVLQQ